MPQELRNNLSEIAEDDLKYWHDNVDSIIRMSCDVRYITEDGVPMLIVGALQASLLDDDVELWMFGSKFLTIKNIKTYFVWVREWIDSHPGRVYARANTRHKEAFLRLFKFKLIGADPDCASVKIYEG